jgi:hypothetical protein
MHLAADGAPWSGTAADAKDNVIMSTQLGTRQRWSDYRPSKTAWFWSCAGCVAATVALGFFWGGWVTSGEAARMAARAADQARTELAASVCVSRFVAAPDAATQLATLRKTDPWARTDLLEKGGWTTVPGLKGQTQDQLSDSNVGDLCAQRLMTATLPTAHTDAKL